LARTGHHRTGPIKDERHRGQYKTNSNSLAAFNENGTQIGIVFETASPFDTPRLMAELVAWVAGERDKAQLHPLLIISIFVVVFLEIHPFQDGNGRLSLEFAREHGRITMADAIKLTNVSRNTLKLHFRSLVAQGNLDFHGHGRGAYYVLH
jgi:Fic family protein